MSLPASPLRLLPTAATFVGWDFHPLKFRAFSRRTMDGQDKTSKLLTLSVCVKFNTNGVRLPQPPRRWEGRHPALVSPLLQL